MSEPKKTTYELLESLYAFVKGESEYTRGEFKYMHEKFDHIDRRFDKIENLTNSQDSRISRLEDSMRIVKTKLDFN